MAEPIFALQMMTLKKQFTEEGIDATFKRVKDVGINNLELSQTPMNDHILAELLAACQKYDMHVISNSVILERFYPNMPGEMLEEDFDNIVRRNKLLGCSYVRSGMLPRSAFNNLEGYYAACKKFDEYGKRLLENGIKFYYHIHHVEFQKYNGKYGLDILLENVDPKHMGIELDTHWVQRGGEDIYEWIDKLAGRIDLFHIKDFRIRTLGGKEISGENFANCIEFAEIGEGNLKFKKIIPYAVKAGAKYFIIEQDQTYGRDPYESIAISVRNLGKMGYANNF